MRGRIAPGLLLGHIVAHGLRGILEIKALLKAKRSQLADRTSPSGLLGFQAVLVS